MVKTFFQDTHPSPLSHGPAPISSIISSSALRFRRISLGRMKSWKLFERSLTPRLKTRKYTTLQLHLTRTLPNGTDQGKRDPTLTQTPPLFRSSYADETEFLVHPL